MSTNGKATKTKSMFRMEVSVEIAIQAKPEKIWALLTNASQFPSWNSTVQKIEGKIADGETIHVVATISPNRTFNLKVAEFVANQRMVWKDGSAPMFQGIRTFTLSPRGNETIFHMNEVFSGIMMPMIAGALPDFVPVFEQYAKDLKTASEK